MRLFVAVWPPADVLDSLAALDRPLGDGVRWTAREQWHVTLRFLGWIDDVDAVVSCLGEVGSWAAPVLAGALAAPPPAGSATPVASAGSATPVASAGPATVLLGPSLVVLPVAGLDVLAARVVELTASLGEPPPSRPFMGHVTLARAKPGIGVRDLAGVPLSATWPVSEVTLVASDLHPRGARYSVVAHFPLRGGTA